MKLIKLSCRKCAWVWEATPNAAETHRRCPYCGSRQVHVHRIA